VARLAGGEVVFVRVKERVLSDTRSKQMHVACANADDAIYRRLETLPRRAKLGGRSAGCAGPEASVEPDSESRGQQRTPSVLHAWEEKFGLQPPSSTLMER
jgi:hypothetical protein